VLVGAGDTSTRARPLRFAGTLPGLTKSAAKLLYAGDGSVVFAAGADGALRAFGTGDRAQRFVADHGAPLFDVALSPDGAVLATAGADGHVKLWTAADGRPAAPHAQLGRWAAPSCRCRSPPTANACSPPPAHPATAPSACSTARRA
jgi:WD40 repeat protein